MVGSCQIEVRPKRGTGWLGVVLGLLVFCGGAGVAQAVLQFDVFLGYDGIVPEASWFPVVCEIKNDGPSFNGVVVIESGSYNQGQTREAPVELPTGTLKRLVIPVFSSTRGYSTWDVRLLDERGRVRAEQTGLRARKQSARNVPLMGALARTAGGVPVIQPIRSRQSELQPAVARLLPSIFPDNPLVLEGLDCLYLNSERAADLRVTQVSALLAWLNAGGHLIVGVEQPSDITAAPWLKNLLPCELKDFQPLPRHRELQEWLRQASGPTNLAGSLNFQPSGLRRRGGSGRNAAPGPEEMAVERSPFGELPYDFTFESAEMQVVAAQVRDGSVLAAAGDSPLVVAATRGRGRVSVLLFSPEREPVRSWKNLPAFWAKLAEVPGILYASSDFNQQSGWSSDGIFGAMIDSRQVHKLPVGWLLLLLIVYLVVIGPLDQYWVKRIGKPMLTWLTFPCYVALFSLVIYVIGYKLRAGESEWNELHVVDVLRNGARAELRGRTYSSVYSPANQKYTVESQQKYATLRGEFLGLWGGGGQANERATVVQNGDSFKGEIFVPVWTSELFVSDWWQPAPLPLSATVRPQGDGWQVRVENRLDRNLTNVMVVIEDRVFKLGELRPEQAKTQTVSREQGMLLKSFMSQYGSRFSQVVGSRQRALGSSASGQISDLPDASVAASFLSQLGSPSMMHSSFTAPPGLDLTPALEHGEAVLLAWAGGYSPVKPMYRFTPRHSQRDTLWRMVVPVR